ncbi:BatD family protein [Paucihalobacter sp.]|uniref:BatD family protein n=1 Tax=Paucihalobacter sp. TaxID=2850405 RepID=UPI002FE419A0
MNFKNHILIIALLFSTLLAAQVKFEAKLSKAKLGLNERLRIDFEMDKDGDNFVPPSFADFTVVGGPNTSVSNTWINGKRSFKKTYSYFLAPKKVGKFTIKQGTIEIDGETYKTFPITVEVTPAVELPTDPNDPNYVASQNIHLVAEVSKANPYLNEPITVTYKLYVSRETGVSNIREIDNPKFSDFWSQNIPTNGLPVQNGQFNGEDYRYVIWRRTVLYPQKSGELKIEPLSLDVTVEVPSNRRDFFGGPLMTQVNKTVSAGARTIKVKPLPEQGKPANFGGAVGEFDLIVSTSKKELKATESLQLTVEVSGKGNMKLFELPKPNIPSALEVYDPVKDDKVSTRIDGMYGARIENYTIVPQFKGKYPIPGISFSYFDLKTEQYKTITSNEMVIDVLDDPMNPVASNANPANIKQAIVANAEAFAYIKSQTNLRPKDGSYFFKSTAFWTSLLAPLLAIPLALIVRRRRESYLSDEVGMRMRAQDKLAKKYLGEAKKSLGQKELFYVALERALHNFLKAKLHIETSEFSKDKIEELLSKRQVSQESVSEFITLLESCELARYSPATDVTMQQDYNNSATAIAAIDKQLR